MCARSSGWRAIVPPELIEGASAQVAAKRAFFQQRLSSRELDVVLLVADGLTNKVIGDRLGLTEGTIKIYLHAIFTKLNVPNRTTLAKLARNYAEL